MNDRVKSETVALGTVTSERVQCGYGERIVIQFNRPLPKFKNNGWNCWHDANFDECQLDRIPPLDHESNDERDPQTNNRFRGWVQGRFTNGQTWVFIDASNEAWDSNTKRYEKPLFRIGG